MASPVFGVSWAEKAAKGAIDSDDEEDLSAFRGVGLTLRDYQLEVRASRVGEWRLAGCGARCDLWLGGGRGGVRSGASVRGVFRRCVETYFLHFP